MPPPKSDSGDFASIMGSTFSPPEVLGGTDLPDGFPTRAQKGVRMVDASKEPGAIDGTMAYDYTIKRAVYLIYRSYEGCQRCTEDLSSGAASLPADGDHTCPHTQLAEYEKTVNLCLGGKAIWGSEQEISQKDGSIVMSVRWYLPTFNAKRAKQTAKQQAQQQAVDDGELSAIPPELPGQKEEPPI